MQGHAAKLGQADSEDLRSGPPYLPKMPGANAGYQLDRGPGGHQNDVETSRTLWLVTRKPEPRANASPIEFQIDYSDAQTPPSDEYLDRDPEYSMEVCVS